MKKKSISKKLVAVILSVVMIVTSIPFMLIGNAAGLYDPAPKFSPEAQEEGASAWLDDDGNVQVVYPAAYAEPTYKGEALSIAFYILELVDTGAKNSIHTNIVLKTIKAEGTSATFNAADIGEIDLENKRYSVTITAVDTENWFSQPIYATVVKVPAVTIDADRFANFSTSSTAVREIMTFESGTDDGRVTQGSQLLYMGKAQESGTPDLSDGIGDTDALRFIMYNQPTGTQAFDTSYSRQTWDFKGAEEIWYWLDLSKVELKGLAFRLKTNEKMWLEWIDDDETLDTEQNASSIVYSTKGTAASAYTGEDPYVYVQREDGGWNKVMLNGNGTLDIGNFKGYIRVPLKFMCSETDSYIDISNQDLASGHDYKSGINNSVQDSDVQNWLRSMTFGRITVDRAGTSIQDALLIHRRGLRSSSGFLNAGDRHLYLFNADGITHLQQSYTNGNPAVDYSKAGYMLAVPLDASKAKTTVVTGNVSTDRAYISNGTVQNRSGGLKAIEDIYNAGFSIESCSAESLQNSFFVDNIFFYRTDGGQYTENTLDGNPNTGNPMSDYYDEELMIQNLIFDEIDKYLVTPGWEDFREINYILDLIEAYRQIFAANGKSTAFLDLSKTDDGDGVGLAAAAAKLNRNSWANAWKAYESCVAEGTYGRANAGKFDLIPTMVRLMEKLPKPENITTVSEALRDEIIKLWKGYSLLNSGQLEMLGKTEEETILKYIALLGSSVSENYDEFVVGQQLADFPYIVYNDFESQELGTKGWQLEDNKDAYTSAVAGGTNNLATDWRHLKGLTTYTTNGSTNITDKDYYGYAPDESDKSQEALDGKVHYNASWATITDNGYMNSNAATMFVDSAFTANNNDGVFHTVTFSRHGKDSANWTEFQANNTGLDNLGAFSTENSTGTPSIGLSLILYVDFTEISNFYFTTNIFTKESDGTPVKARPNMGVALNDQAKIDNWKYFILHPETGEWVINHTTSQWCFTSTKTDESWGDQFSLDNYQGYIMIPLYHVKVPQSAVSEPKLDGNATWLNNIYAIQFCIGGANGNSLDGKSFTIDNVGFTYDPVAYANHDWTCYAEVFGAKSLPAANFEKMVDEIDPYEKSTLQTEVTNALAVYNSLSAYQQSLVQEEKDILDLYLQYVAGTNSLPNPTYTPEQVKDFVDSLPAEIKNASVTGENDIPHPGFSNGSVNYAAMGITREKADEIIKYYQESYSRFSKTQKATITNSAELINAYNMCMRMTETLEDIKNASITFLPELTSLYTVKYDYEGDGVLDDLDESVADSDAYKVGNFVSIAGRDEVESFRTDKYNSLQYYSKTSIDDGSIYPQLQNTSRGFTYFLNNTRSFTVDGEEINGGIITFQKKMQDIYEMANGHITNQTLFTPEELQSVRDVINEYNAFLPAYYNVEELYELEQAISRLFPTVSTEEVDVKEILLSEEKLTGDAATYKVTYAEVLDLKDKGDNYYIRVTSKNGAMTNAYGDTVAYNVAIGSTNTTSGNIVEDSPYKADVANNTYTPGNPMSLTIVPSLDTKPTGLSGAVYDDITVELVYSETVSETVDGTTTEKIVETIVNSQIITVSYSMGDAYTVTIPGSFPVEWGDIKPQVVSYSVTTEMAATSKLTVGVASDGTGKMLSTVDPTLALDYTTDNFVDQEFGNKVTDAKPDPAPTVTVSGWDSVPVGEYKTTLTYTVVYDNGNSTS